jgi:hypothetical protein
LKNQRNKAEYLNRISLQAKVNTKEAKDGGSITPEEMALINQYTRKDLAPADVYVYPLILCDNDRDRDFEYFKITALEKLKDLFTGVTGIKNHSWNCSGQHSRVFKTEIVTETDKKSFAGEPYTFLKAWAYTIQKGNEDFIANIDAGILKEVSIGFSLEDKICSVCGNSFYDAKNCPHYPGMEYDWNGNRSVCYLEMYSPVAAYEYSFVAVPAQPAAGVTKVFDETADDEKKVYHSNIITRGETDLKNFKGIIDTAKAEKADEISISIADAEKMASDYDAVVGKNAELQAEVDSSKQYAALGKEYITDMKADCLRLGKMAEGDAFDPEVMNKLFDKCDLSELKAFKDKYQKQIDKLYPPAGQTTDGTPGSKAASADNSMYKV